MGIVIVLWELSRLLSVHLFRAGTATALIHNLKSSSNRDNGGFGKYFIASNRPFQLPS